MSETPSLLEQARAEVERQANSPAKEVTLQVDPEGATAKVDVPLGRGWSASAWARYYWNKTYAWAAEVSKKWT